MRYTLEWLVMRSHETLREIRPGVWVPARPEPGPFLWRLRDAWEVLRGRLDAVEWPERIPPAESRLVTTLLVQKKAAGPGATFCCNKAKVFCFEHIRPRGAAPAQWKV